MSFKVIPSLAQDSSTFTAGTYLYQVVCSDHDQIVINTNRIAEIILKDCSKETVANTIVSLTASLFVPVYQQLMNIYYQTTESNVLYLHGIHFCRKTCLFWNTRQSMKYRLVCWLGIKKEAGFHGTLPHSSNWIIYSQNYKTWHLLVFPLKSNIMHPYHWLLQRANWKESKYFNYSIIIYIIENCAHIKIIVKFL